MKYHTFQGEDSSDSQSDSLDSLPSGLFKDEYKSGLSLLSAAMYITSLLAGMGVLALPHAMAGTGWFGLGIIALASVNSCYCAIILGRCWLLMEDRWEEYREKFRYPYPAIGLRAVGSWMRYTVSVALNITLIGIATVYILLCAQVFQSLTKNFFYLSYNLWILILSAILCPLTWFGSIEEFWLAAAGALVTAGAACTTLFVSILVHSPGTEEGPPERTPDFNSFSLAFGTILFAFGGVFFFPSVQNDMKDRQQFPKSAMIGFFGLLILYLPVTISSYVILGHSVHANVLICITPGPLRTAVEVSLALHVFLAFLLLINPVAQELEEALNIRPSFNWKRCTLRTVIMVVILIIAFVVPHFDKIINLIGGSTITLLTFIFPPLFYILLRVKTKPDLEEKRITVYELIFFIQIMITGVAGGIACTYFAIQDIYVAITSKEPPATLVPV